MVSKFFREVLQEVCTYWTSISMHRLGNGVRKRHVCLLFTQTLSVFCSAGL